MFKRVFNTPEEFVSKTTEILKDPLKANKQNSQKKTKGPTWYD